MIHRLCFYFFIQHALWGSMEPAVFRTAANTAVNPVTAQMDIVSEDVSLVTGEPSVMKVTTTAGP